MRGPIALLAAAMMTLGSAAGAAPDPAARDLAPSGRLRAAINYGNPVLAHRADDGALSGVSVDLARELARRLGLELDLVPYDAAGKVTQAVAAKAWDVAFLAVDPVRAGEITFSAPYVLIEGTYVVPDASPLRRIEEFDRDGLRIAVGRGSAYDLFLTRELTHATLVRAATSADAVTLFRSQNLEALAGVKQPLVAFAKDHPGFRVIEGRFMAIAQAMGVPNGRPEAARYVAAFVEEMKRSGFVSQALARHGQGDAAVAPPAE